MKLNFPKHKDPTQDPITVIAAAEVSGNEKGDSCMLMCKQFAQDIIVLRKEIKSMEKDVEFLNALEAAGVDNWEGYSEALDGD